MPAQEATGSGGGLRTFRKRRISVDIDPSHRFATVNYCTAEGLFDHLDGDGERRWRHLDSEPRMQYREFNGLFAVCRTCMPIEKQRRRRFLLGVQRQWLD
jgi:hypothetical protein